MGIVLKRVCVSGLLLIDENNDIWYSSEDVVIQVAPSEESSVDRRSG